MYNSQYWLGATYTYNRFRGNTAAVDPSVDIERIPEQLVGLSDVVTMETENSGGSVVYLKYWYRDDVFTCFLLNDFTLQVSFWYSPCLRFLSLCGCEMVDVMIFSRDGQC